MARIHEAWAWHGRMRQQRERERRVARGQSEHQEVRVASPSTSVGTVMAEAFGRAVHSSNPEYDKFIARIAKRAKMGLS